MDSKQEWNLILGTPHWKVILMPDQKYLGRCVVVLKRKCGDLAELKQNEILDFFKVVRKTESLLKKTFNATMFNWACLMNNAYQETVPNPQVHWHFRPRYNHPVEFGNQTFNDSRFGHYYLEEPEEIPSQEVLDKIAEELRKNL